jgi:DNA-binding protein Fis
MSKTTPQISLSHFRRGDTYIKDHNAQYSITESKKAIKKQKIRQKVHEMVHEIELLLNLSPEEFDTNEIYELVVKFNSVMGEKLA